MKNLLYKSVDIMKLSKDNVLNPLSDTYMRIVAQNLRMSGLSHISISVPLDYPDYAKRWAQAIHGFGLKVLHRGTWNAIEGLYGVEKAVGMNRPPDTINYWVSKTREYILSNPTLFEDGDLWGPLPERTENIFQDETSFLPYDEPGIQANYVDFFNRLVDDCKVAFEQIGKQVKIGFTANNYSEVASGWIYQSFFDKAGITCVDHYGVTHTPSEMDGDLRGIYASKVKPVFLQEWGNYWNNGDIHDAWAMFDTLTILANDGVLVGFNYWGGWPGNPESILNPDFSLNDKGKLLGEYFSNVVPVPLPEAEKFVEIEGISNMVGLTNKGNIWKYYNKKWTQVPLPSF